VLAILCLYSAFFEYLSLGSKLRFLSSCSGNTGFSNSYSAADNDLVVFGIIIGVGLAALVLSLASPGKWYVGWWIGWAMLGPVAGLSVAFTMMFLKGGEGLLVDSLVGRWIIIAFFGILGKLGVTLTKWRGAVCTSV
jgi:hypothetical protein